MLKSGSRHCRGPTLDICAVLFLLYSKDSDMERIPWWTFRTYLCAGFLNRICYDWDRSTRPIIGWHEPPRAYSHLPRTNTGETNSKYQGRFHNEDMSVDFFGQNRRPANLRVA